MRILAEGMLLGRAEKVEKGFRHLSLSRCWRGTSPVAASFHLHRGISSGNRLCSCTRDWGSECCLSALPGDLSSRVQPLAARRAGVADVMPSCAWSPPLASPFPWALSRGRSPATRQPAAHGGSGFSGSLPRVCPISLSLVLVPFDLVPNGDQLTCNDLPSY